MTRLDTYTSIGLFLVAVVLLILKVAM